MDPGAHNAEFGPLHSAGLSLGQATGPETRPLRHSTDQALPLTVMLVSFLPLWEEATTARYWMTFLVFSVFPAPDSPLKDTGVMTHGR